MHLDSNSSGSSSIIAKGLQEIIAVLSCIFDLFNTSVYLIFVMQSSLLFSVFADTGKTPVYGKPQYCCANANHRAFHTD